VISIAVPQVRPFPESFDFDAGFDSHERAEKTERLKWLAHT
jgi:hypothetical protein